MACPSCNSERTETGKIISPYGVLFQADSSAFMNSKKSLISATVCLDSGSIFDFKANELEKLNK
ncbi:hypothetical protein KPL40_09055 [Clostridium gasigenes]|uniref:hypothetical protein n=1 Tax=Clostridium gasigenes TaxID=94869 RepID=UPI001C0B8730|nr:hypothetical protein [Clostridium gasigenes]MBU3132605.1 hypothetical protein [Clostridium gasigenes]